MKIHIHTFGLVSQFSTSRPSSLSHSRSHRSILGDMIPQTTSNQDAPHHSGPPESSEIPGCPTPHISTVGEAYQRLCSVAGFAEDSCWTLR